VSAVTAATTRFALDEVAARAWLAAGVAADFMDHIAADNTLPGIDPDWIPLLDNADEIAALISGACARGIMTQPPGARADLDADGGGEGYRWLVCLHHGSEQRLTLAGPFVNQNIVGDPTARGAEAGLAVLREYRDSGNEGLDDLAAYIGITRTGDSDVGTTGELDR
jgi:hypothetical protein